jgi:hypothetical protein
MDIQRPIVSIKASDIRPARIRPRTFWNGCVPFARETLGAS